MSLPSINTNRIKEKYLSEDNIKSVLNTLQDRLCLPYINRDFGKTVIDNMKLISKKYPTNSLTELNTFTANHIADRYLPQKKVNDIIQRPVLPTNPMPTSVEPRGLKPINPRTNQVVEIENMADTQNQNDDSEVQVQLNDFISSSKYDPKTNTFYNKKLQAYLNKQYNIIYSPVKDKYYDAITGDTITKTEDDKELTRNLFFGTSETDSRHSTLSEINFNPGKTNMLTNISDLYIRKYTISIDSRHRDIRRYPSASRYQIIFQKKNTEQFGYLNSFSKIIKGVTRIELVKGIIPNVFKFSQNVITDTYLFISLDEVLGEFHNSSPRGKNILAKLIYDLGISSPATKETVDYLEVDPVLAHIDYKPEPLPTSLTALTISILNFNGNEYNFGSDSLNVRYWQANGANTLIWTWLPHNLSTGDIIYTRYTTNPILDDIIDGISVLVLTPIIFSVPFDTTSVAAALPPNIGGPPLNPENPLNSSGQPFPTAPPNDPNNPSIQFGFILKPQLQNSFTFEITTLDKTSLRSNFDEVAEIASGY